MLRDGGKTTNRSTNHEPRTIQLVPTSTMTATSSCPSSIRDKLRDDVVLAAAGDSDKNMRKRGVGNANANGPQDVDDVGVAIPLAATATATVATMNNTNTNNYSLPATPPNQTGTGTGNHNNVNENSNADDPATWSKSKRRRMRKKEAAKQKSMSSNSNNNNNTNSPGNDKHSPASSNSAVIVIDDKTKTISSNSSNSSKPDVIYKSNNDDDNGNSNNNRHNSRNNNSSRRGIKSSEIMDNGNQKIITNSSSSSSAATPWRSPMKSKQTQQQQQQQNHDHLPGLDLDASMMDTEEKTVSLDAIKYSVLGRAIPSIYDNIQTATPPNYSNQQSSSSSSSIMPTTTTSIFLLQQQLRHELACPICHNLLYNPVSLFCGHSFCQVCLNWWLDRQLLEKQQEQEHQQGGRMSHRRRRNTGGRRNIRGDGDDDFMSDIDSGDENDSMFASNHKNDDLHATCPSCRGPIPNNNGNHCDNGSDVGEQASNKPTIRVNTALKAVLENLFSDEMNQRRRDERQQKRKARGGEMGGMHSRGCGVEVVPMPMEDDELGFLRELIRKTTASTILNEGGNRDGRKISSSRQCEDEENGWVGMFAISNQPGWSKRNQPEGGRYSIYNHGSGAKIMIRRNVVLDESDQRYQMSLGFTKCVYSIISNKNGVDGDMNNWSVAATDPIDSRGVLDIELCLLTMEEDEVEDSGFPMFACEGSDDAALICTSHERAVHSCIQSSARVVSILALEDGMAKSEKEGETLNDNEALSALQSVREVPLSRGMIGRDGTVRFRIDVRKVLDSISITKEGAHNGDGALKGDIPTLLMVKLRFVHADTGAAMELRLPSRSDTYQMLDGRDGEIVFGARRQDGVVKENDGRTRFLLDEIDDDDEESDDEPNEYMEDGFLVNGSDEEETDSHQDEASFSVDDDDDDDDDDDGECQVCLNGGDLIVCDGGSHGGGCGHLYHIHCIGRRIVPPGNHLTTLCLDESSFMPASTFITPNSQVDLSLLPRRVDLPLLCT